MTLPPVLWSFRRCPYAIRARLAIVSAGINVELREILLRDKPEAFVQTSPSRTVPALRLEDRVLDESLDIMIWALRQNDPQQLLNMPDEGWDLIAENDGPFKTALDHEAERAKAAVFLVDLDTKLSGRSWLFGDQPTIADLALLPFARQFAHIDRAWFDAQPWPNLIAWLDRFLNSETFAGVMSKYPPWSDGDVPLIFGGAADQ